MASYAYGNTRLRAMKSRLLTRQELESLAEAANMQALIAELAKTPYKRSIEAALARVSGLECISDALRTDLESALRKIGRFYTGRPGEMVRIVLRAYDIRNLKAILRGLARHAAPNEILFTAMPVGELTDAILSELARAADPRAAIDLLATMALSFANPLLSLRASKPGAGTPEMELRLDQWYYREAFGSMQRKRQRKGVLLAALRLEADLVNLHTALRMAYSPEERDVLKGWLGTEDVGQLFVGPGRLPFQLLARAGTQETVQEAVDSLAGTPYEAPLRDGFEKYRSTGRLSVFERQLNRARLDWLSRLVGKDPLGIGVVLGYLALKTNEISNLRWIAHGIYLGTSGETIRSELVTVT